VENVDRIEAALKDIREETGEDAGTNEK
jgi:hypothetical protein